MNILHAVFPNRCKLCSSIITANEILCTDCGEEMLYTGAKPCFFCGAAKNDCRCKKRRNFYDAIISPFYYKGSAALGIKQLKFKANANAADFFGKAIAISAEHFYANVHIDTVTFVPTTQKVEKDRGYNQSKLIAEHTAAYLDLPIKQLLIKTYETQPQRTLKAHERSGNILGVFEPSGEDVKGRNILLIDDIRTTGSTLNECAKTLLIEGASSVYCAVAAVTLSSFEIEKTSKKYRVLNKRN